MKSFGYIVINTRWSNFSTSGVVKLLLNKSEATLYMQLSASQMYIKVSGSTSLLLILTVKCFFKNNNNVATLKNAAERYSVNSEPHRKSLWCQSARNDGPLGQSVFLKN